MFCPECGTRIEDPSSFCGECGSDVRLLVGHDIGSSTVHACGVADGNDRPPPCPACGEPVRVEGPRPPAFPWAIVENPAWNAGWDGSCESCGHVFQRSLDTIPSPFGGAVRRVEFGPGREAYVSGFDAGTLLSGVEITVRDTGDGSLPHGSAPRVRTLFLANAEIRALFEALRGELSVCLDQPDWGADWT